MEQRSGFLSPSIMCVDFMHVAENIAQFEQCGVDYIHIDIMDNHYVPNITIGFDFIKQLKQVTDIPLDVHLMIERPEQTLGLFEGVLDEHDYLIPHYEAAYSVQRALSLIREMGVGAGVALNPATPLDVLDYILDDIRLVTVMTVNPGFAGQRLIPATLQKIRDLRIYLEQKGKADYLIEVDGNVSFENAVIMREMGADIFVGGSSSVFSKTASFAENCRKMNRILGKTEPMEKGVSG